VRWSGPPSTHDNVVEREFVLLREQRVVPGITWSPAHPTKPAPVVLLGHGGSGHKRADRQLRLGRWFAGTLGATAVAIDGPYHGDRVPEPLASAEYQRQMASDGIDQVTDGMVGDWLAALDAVGRLDGIDSTRAAYVGLSMGTRFGVPFVAAAGSRLVCAVLGKYGMQQPAGMPPAIDMAPRFRRDAPAITAPVLFHLQRGDELFPRAGQLALFELLGSADKRLIELAGGHGDTAPEAVAVWCAFVRWHLVL
jgi:dienelactone hydrolase